MKTEDIVRLVAETAVGAGLRTEAGDLVFIEGSPPHRDFMLAAARECWRRGARYVFLRYFDDRAFRDLVELAPEAWLDGVPEAIRGLWDAFAADGWTRLVTWGDEDPRMLEGLDLGRLGRAMAARHAAAKAYMEASMALTLPWCLVPYPTDAWARLALGSPNASGADLWPDLMGAMRLDEGGSGTAIAHFDALAARARALTERRFSALRFAGPGTDLRVGLPRGSRWLGGTIESPKGRRFTPNIPTEEVFSTPDFRKTEGRVACTRPVMMLDQIVEGAWLEFRGGEVVASGASTNAAALDRFLAIDAGARRLGEVALVDCSSPVWRTGRLYRNPLVDENAACHIGLGHGIAAAFDGAAAMGEKEREAAGFNDSSEHNDLMIGSDRVSVWGVDEGGRETALIREGRFVA